MKYSARPHEWEIGRVDRIRTCDPLHTMQILSLRQTKVFYHIIVISIFLKLVVHLNYIYLMLVACG